MKYELMSKLHLKDFEKKDAFDVTNLVNQSFGESFMNSKPSLFEQPILIVAVINSKIIGFCSGRVLDKKIGMLGMLVVHPNFQKQGIGTTLFKARMKKFVSLNVQHFNLHHWVTTTLAEPKIAIKHGFELKETVPNYWQEESLKLSYHCAQCGPPPCLCSCKIYEKN